MQRNPKTLPHKQTLAVEKPNLNVPSRSRRVEKNRLKSFGDSNGCESIL
jgi:hypothetical protein